MNSSFSVGIQEENIGFVFGFFQFFFPPTVHFLEGGEERSIADGRDQRRICHEYIYIFDKNLVKCIHFIHVEGEASRK